MGILDNIKGIGQRIADRQNQGGAAPNPGMSAGEMAEGLSEANRLVNEGDVDIAPTVGPASPTGGAPGGATTPIPDVAPLQDPFAEDQPLDPASGKPMSREAEGLDVSSAAGFWDNRFPQKWAGGGGYMYAYEPSGGPDGGPALTIHGGPNNMPPRTIAPDTINPRTGQPFWTGIMQEMQALGENAGSYVEADKMAPEQSGAPPNQDTQAVAKSAPGRPADWQGGLGAAEGKRVEQRPAPKAGGPPVTEADVDLAPTLGPSSPTGGSPGMSPQEMGAGLAEARTPVTEADVDLPPVMTPSTKEGQLLQQKQDKVTPQRAAAFLPDGTPVDANGQPIALDAPAATPGGPSLDQGTLEALLRQFGGGAG